MSDFNYVQDFVYDPAGMQINNSIAGGSLADEDNDALLKTLSSVVEPAILAILGLLVGSLAVSMFMPLFDLATTAGGV